MAGIQQYTSSLFVQSGSIAKFKSGLEVTESVEIQGSVIASNYFDLDGNEITGGGTAAEFFAGSGSGVSASNPSSVDTFVLLPPDAQNTGQLNNPIFIHTTHSSTFSPNHYAFVQITDEFTTVQEGGLDKSNYAVGTLDPGVYRYLVYGAQTGSGGETHQVYSTVFVKGFVNEAPVVIVPTASAATMSIAHDSTVGELILHFTNSFDPNSEDAIAQYTASRALTADPSDVTPTQATYTLVMSHSNFGGQAVHFSAGEVLQTSSLDIITLNGLGQDVGYVNTLFFTASVSNYSIDDSNRIRYQNRFDTEDFTVTLRDYSAEAANQGVAGVTTKTFQLRIDAPPTASISNIKVKFENDGFTGIDADALTHTLLYDRTESLSSASIAELHDRYTSSLIRLSTRADIIPPTGYDPSSTVTEIKIPTQSSGENIQYERNFKFAKFEGANGGSTASLFKISDVFGGTYSSTESLGYTSFTFKPTNFTNNTQSIVIGARNSSKDDLNKTTAIRHGSNNHYEAFTTAPNTLTFQNIPNINISDIVVEVESGSWGTNAGYPSLTSSLLYGYTSSLLSSQTQSALVALIPTGSSDTAVEHPQYNNYVSSSVVRLRVKAKITEPFGPDHKPITFTLTGSKDDNSLQFFKVFTFSTHSGTDCINSSSNYNSETKQRLVGTYTSSWQDFNFPSGIYNFTTQLASSSNAGSTIDTISTAVVSMSNYNNVELSNLVYETEHSGLTGSGVNDVNIVTSTTRSVLYGHEHSIFGVSSSYHNHPSSSLYASHSLFRMRVRGKITEPFGPATSKLDFTFKNKGPGTSPLDSLTNAFTINTTSSNVFINNQLVTVFTSSLIGKNITFENVPSYKGPSKQTDYTISGSVTFDEDSTEEFIGTSNLSINNPTISQIAVIDTPATIIEDISYETETFGHSKIDSTNTTRSILYGDPHITNANSASATWVNHPSASTYASHSVTRFRVKAKITEPLGFLVHSSSFENKWISSSVYSSSKLDFFTGSSAIEFSSSTYDTQGRLAVVYTSSFMGAILSSSKLEGINYLFTSGNILHEPSGENKFTTASGISSNVLVKDTPQVIITKVHEFEEFGHSASNASDSGISPTTRTVLYGDSHTTNATSGSTSWENHPNSASYASHSVSRARIRIEIIEPVGPAHYKIKNTKNLDGSWETLLAFTGSNDFETSSSAYDGQDRLVTNYTESWTGRALPLDAENFGGSQAFSFNSATSFDSNIISSEENSLSSTTANGSITVNDTPKTQFTFTPIETETFGESNVAIENPIESNQSLVSRSIRVNQLTTDVTGSGITNLFTGSSVSRFRTKVTITEPLGYIHHGSDIRIKFNHTDGDDKNINGPYQSFSTNSLNIFDSSSAYDNQDRLVTSYTSSFTGSGLKSTLPSNRYKALFTPNNTSVIHDPSGENGHNFTTAETDTNLFLVISSSEAGDAQTKIDDTIIEVESGSFLTNVGHSNLTSSILYGFTSSLLSSTTKSLIDDVVGISHNNYSDYISQSIVRLRIKTKITEPFGAEPNIVTASIQTSSTTPIEAFDLLPLNSPTFYFDTDGDLNGGLEYTVTTTVENVNNENVQVSRFTSSFIEIRIPSGTYTFTSSFSSSNINGEDISNISTAEISMSGVSPTKFENLHYEIEKHGYAGSGSNDVNITSNTTRTVLFGDNHLIHNGTGSSDTGEYFANHASSSVYASQSVARFRLRGKMIEPFGPGTTNSTIGFNITASNYNNSTFGITFITPTTAGTYNVNKELVTIFTSSFESQSITLREADYGFNSAVDFHVSGNITHNPISLNQFIVPNPSFSTITVKDTPKVIITKVHEFEEYGHSASNASDSGVTEVTRSVLYGDSHITNDTSGSTVWENHPSASTYASHSVVRARVRVEIIEPVGPAHDKISITKTLSSSWEAIQAFTGSTDFETSSSIYDSSNRLKIAYTESWTGRAILLDPSNYGSSENFSFDSTTTSNISEENGLDVTTTDSSILVKDTPATIIEDISYETETFGHSSLPSTSTTRSVLYGDSHITNATSESATWINHPSASTYASHSVTRFRVKAKVTEPLGFLVFTSSFEEKISSPNVYETSSLFNFFSGSTNVSNSSVYDSQDRLITSYTTSFHGHILSSSVIDGVNYLFTSGNILHNPSGENKFTTASGISSNVLVKDTPKTIIKNIVYETETFGHSSIPSTNTVRTVLYGDSHITNETSESAAWENHQNSASYASHSVSRFRVRAKVIEPLGYLIFTSSFEEIVSSFGVYETSSLFNFFSGSPNIENLSIYDGQDRLITDYTTSFHGHILSSSIGGNSSYLFTSGNILHEPIGENKFTTESGISSTMLVKDTPKVIVTNIHEFEEFGYSASNAFDSGITETTRTVLYGDAFKTNDGTGSGETGNNWENHASASIYASHSVSRARLRTKIIEPLGYAHATITFSKFLTAINLGNIQAFTGSFDFEDSSSIYDSSDRLVIAYTESWRGKDVELGESNRGDGGSQNYNFVSTTSTDILGENGISVSGNPGILTIKNTPAAQITINKIEIGSGSVTAGGAEHDNDTADPNIIKFIPFNSSSTKGNPSDLDDYLEPHSLTRFRILADIIEPMGHAHYSTNINYTKQINSVAGTTNGSVQSFATHSEDITNVNSFYNDNTEFIAAYTSSFLGEDLEESNPNFYKFFIDDVILNDENTEPDPIINLNVGNHELTFKVSSSDTDPLQINDIVVEIESASGDLLTGYGTDKGHYELTSSLLYGYTASLLSSQTESLITDNIVGGIGHPLYNQYRSASIIRYRVKSRIVEPFGSETHLVSASFKAVGAVGESSEDIITLRQVTITDHFVGHSGTPIPSSQNLLTSMNLQNVDGNFTGNETLRLVSLSIKGDLDNEAGETILSNTSFPHGLTVGSQRIIETADQFLNNRNNYHVLLPQNLTQVDTNNAIELENVTFTTNPQTESINMVDGEVEVKMSIGNTIASNFPIRLSATFEFDEVTGQQSTTQFEDIMLSPTFSFGENQPTPSDSNLALEVRSSSISFIEGSDGLPRKTIAYTSSWVELQTPTGSFELLPSFQSASDTTFVSSLNTPQNANVTMSNTLPTQLVDLKYETEKHGHAGSGSNDVNIVTDTTRTVLYGDSRVTNATSESTVWINHPSASTYASHSVTRFRVRGKIIEPFGPATSVIDVNLLLSSSINSGHGESKVNFQNINTNLFAIAENYNDNNKLITTFTSSFTEDITLDANSSNTPNSTENYIASGTINYSSNHNSATLPGTNTINVSTPTTTSINVIDTPAAQITINNIETETFGESNVGIKNNNISTPGIISRSILYNESKTRGTGSGVNDVFTGSVVTRFRVLANVIEPLGYLHYPIEQQIKFDDTVNSLSNHFQTFSTNSTDIFDSQSLYDNQDRLTVQYTSSFTGSRLSPNASNNFYIASHSNVNNPFSGENNIEVVNPTTSELYFTVSQSFSDVVQPSITNFRLEVEKDRSGSGVGSFVRHTNVLHGSQSTETDHIKNATYTHLDSSGSLVSVRVLATIEEPPGDQHNPLNISIGGHSGNLINIALSTASIHTASSDITLPTATQGLIGKYTSSFFVVPFTALGYQSNGTLEDRLTYTVSASIDDMDNVDSFTTESPLNTHSIVHVTGALSSSIAITLNTGSLISSSFFNVGDSEKSLYYVYPVNNYSYGTDLSTDVTLFDEPTLGVTPPTFTSESTITFNDGHLDVEYTASNRHIDFVGATQGYFTHYEFSNPDSGQAILQITKPSLAYDSPDANTVRKGTIITKIVNLLEGNGTESVSTDLYVIPAPAKPMSGDLNVNIGAHPTKMTSSFYFGLIASNSFDHYSGSIGPDNPTTVISSSRILFASTSLGYNYSMSLFTHTNNIAVYSNGNSLGDFINNNIAYNFGDSGSLELKINDTTKTNIDLQSNFNVNTKNTNQTLTNYGTDGTASFTEGRLIITKVAPFNNVSQSIFAHGYNFPNGFQAFNASIELDSRVREGYNFLELIHNISPGHTQSLNTFDWYYNDGIESASFKPNPTVTFTDSPGTKATHSLSGVSYFKKDVNFTASLNDIYNLANNVYPLGGGVGVNTPEPILITKRADSDGFKITGDGKDNGPNDNGFRRLRHQTTENATYGRRGLRFSESDVNFIPTPTSTASLQLEINANSISNDVDPIQGKVFNITVAQNLRDKTDPHNYIESDLFTASIGRFIQSGSDLSSLSTVNYFTPTEETASFFDEDRRWASASMAVSQALNPGDIGGTSRVYSFWTSTSHADYNSSQNISNTKDLQQLFTGELVYPSLEYTGSSPNSVNYSTIDRNEQREYYAAIKCPTDVVSDPKQINIIISGNLSQGDIPLFSQQNPNPSLRQNYNEGNINIYLRIPGPISSNTLNNANDPGTGWGSATGTLGGLGTNNTNEEFHLNPFENGSTEKKIKLGLSFGSAGLSDSQGVLLLKIVMSGSIHPTGSIKQITVEPR